MARPQRATQRANQRATGPANVAARLDVKAEVKALTAALAEHEDPERARFEKAYMKSELRFVGAGMPAVRRIATGWSRAHPDLDAPSIRAVCEALIRSDVFDLRSIGVAILAREHPRLSRADLPWLLELCRHCAGWAHVDAIATDPISHIVARDPSALPLLRGWIEDPSFWVRRAAILAQMRQFMRGEGDFELFTELTVPLLEEKEFFIRKAIGWMLRTLSRKRPAPVRAYVAAHGARMSGVTWREAVKYLDLPESQRRPSKKRQAPVSATAGRRRSSGGGRPKRAG